LTFLFTQTLFIGKEKEKGVNDMADSDIQPLGPHEKKMYEAEYKHGADLFKQAAQEYTKSNNMYQKAEFKDVMDKAMQVMQDAARAMMRQELLKQNDQIAKDFSAFQDSPSNTTEQQLAKDLDKAKKSV
jgi:hypothetical protein